MSVDRAYTWMGPGEVRAGNRWMERSWSRFLGQTTELVSGGGRIEWLREACHEFEFTMNGAVCRLMDFGDISYSDRCDAHAATLEMELAGGGKTLLSEVLVFHAWPGMLRRWWLVNRTAEEISFDAGRVEWLSPRWEAELDDARLVLRHGGSGLIFFALQESRWIPVGEKEYALELPAAAPLAVGGRVLLAQAGTLAFEQGLDEALEKTLPRFMEALRQYEEDERASVRLRHRELLRSAPAEPGISSGD